MIRPAKTALDFVQSVVASRIFENVYLAAVNHTQTYNIDHNAQLGSGCQRV